MADFNVKFTGKIDRRSPTNEGEPSNPVLRYNWISRDGVLKKPPGHEAVFTDLGSVPRWQGRYYSVETGVISEKSFVYTENGRIRVLDDSAGTSTEVASLLNENAFPKHWLFKTVASTKLYLVDGVNLYAYDGNADNKFELISILDTGGDSILPIDLIEHRDRLFLISEASLYVSKNLFPEVFDDATDSIQIIVGSGKGRNLALGKIEDKLYILNTEGLFVLDGDVISALASTFEVRLVDDRKIIAGGTVQGVEKAILFLADDLELWSWDGSTTQMLSFELKLKDFVNQDTNLLKKAVSVYHDNFYKMSFVENGEVEPDIEIWWDAFEDKIDIVRGRKVSCYMRTDATEEAEYLEMGQNDSGTIVREGRTNDFNGVAIATRLRTRDITPKKGHNVRFTAFYPEFMPTGDRNIIIRYLLDSRSSNPTGVGAEWIQNLRGEVKTLGELNIVNQGQFTDRVRPKINYARGESIGFEIIEATLGLKADFMGIGMDFIAKQRSKGKTVGA